jgi:hypothetical protein
MSFEVMLAQPRKERSIPFTSLTSSSSKPPVDSGHVQATLEKTHPLPLLVMRNRRSNKAQYILAQIDYHSLKSWECLYEGR